MFPSAGMLRIVDVVSGRSACYFHPLTLCLLPLIILPAMPDFLCLDTDSPIYRFINRNSTSAAYAGLRFANDVRRLHDTPSFIIFKSTPPPIAVWGYAPSAAGFLWFHKHRFPKATTCSFAFAATSATCFLSTFSGCFSAARSFYVPHISSNVPHAPPSLSHAPSYFSYASFYVAQYFW